MEQKAFSAWLKQAVGQIRFQPDRAEIKKELLNHMEDRKQDFLEQHMTDFEAEQAVLQAMGDARTVGKALNSVHSPLLGYAWLISKVVLGVLAAICIIGGLFWADSMDGMLQQWTAMEHTVCEEPCDDLREIESGLTYEEGPYTFRLDHGSVRQMDLWQETVLCFRIYSLRPWQPYPMGLHHVVVTDSYGNTFTAATPQTDGKPVGLVNINAAQAWELPYWNCHILMEYNPWGEGEFPEWLRFEIPNTNIDFTVWADGEVRKNP